MNALFALPIELRLAIVGVIGCLLGAVVNWAVYSLAWNRRPISPWSRPPEGVLRRGWADRVPLYGWLRLRREVDVHGRAFWIRPLLIEAAFGVGLAALYWWEVGHCGLIVGQLAQILNNPNSAAAVAIPDTFLHAQFAAHAILFTFMAAASFIDIDEKLIPDAVSVVGTLVGLMLAALMPTMLLPQANTLPPPVADALTIRLEGPDSQPIIVDDQQVVAQNVTVTAPNLWPARLHGAPQWRSLLLGLACYWLWCFALIERIWRGRRGIRFGLMLIGARLARDLRRMPMLLLLPAGTLAIVGTWWLGGDRWAGLLTSLVGLAGGGGIVWAVRIIGTAALKREAMGFGDVTLMMMIGTFLGWQACLMLFFLAPFAGLVVGICQWMLHSDDVIPYGPFLCIAAGYVIVAWAAVWNWGHQVFEIGWLIPAVLVVCLFAMGLMLGIWQMIKEAIFGRM